MACCYVHNTHEGTGLRDVRYHKLKLDQFARLAPVYSVIFIDVFIINKTPVRFSDTLTTDFSSPTTFPPFSHKKDIVQQREGSTGDAYGSICGAGCSRHLLAS